MRDEITLDSLLDSLSELHPMGDDVSPLERNKLIVEIYKARLIADAIRDLAKRVETAIEMRP